MALKFTIPSLTNADAAKYVKESILTSEPDARVDINLEEKTVMIESKASEETIKQLITATGHTIQ